MKIPDKIYKIHKIHNKYNNKNNKMKFNKIFINNKINNKNNQIKMIRQYLKTIIPRIHFKYNLFNLLFNNRVIVIVFRIFYQDLW